MEWKGTIGGAIKELGNYVGIGTSECLIFIIRMLKGHSFCIRFKTVSIVGFDCCYIVADIIDVCIF